MKATQEAIVRTARYFEAYTTGDLDREEAKAMYDEQFNPEP